MVNPEILRPTPQQNPLKDFVSSIDIIQSDVEHNYAKYEATGALEKFFEVARGQLWEQRKLYLNKVYEIDQAPPDLKLDIARKNLLGPTRSNLLEILARIAELAVVIGAKKAVRDEDVFQPEQEAKARARSVEYGILIGMTPERALQVTNMSIRFTSAIQELVRKRKSS